MYQVNYKIRTKNNSIKLIPRYAAKAMELTATYAIGHLLPLLGPHISRVTIVIGRFYARVAPTSPVTASIQQLKPSVKMSNNLTLI
jgi:hypothetical protein